MKIYLLALFLPPVAVFKLGTRSQGYLNILLTLLLWSPGAMHAILVVNDKKNEERMERQEKRKNNKK
ncbi:YqaE/Pmp3 family membrane protein [Salipaludibacillus sp. HK11]|uniref:YqaE/Pmp3 family membrane protein n=1 Tax=Salipaludibacillus sp. HK11 TaxID=3394320 RepID=UPI0039FC2E95